MAKTVEVKAVSECETCEEILTEMLKLSDWLTRAAFRMNFLIARKCMEACNE